MTQVIIYTLNNGGYQITHAAINTNLTITEIAESIKPTNAESYIIGDDANLPEIVTQWKTAQDEIISKKEFCAQAQIALDKSDIAFLRAIEGGHAINDAWKAYRAALRAIVNGSDTISTVLPTRPDYQI